MKEPTIFRNYLVEMTSLFLRQNGVEIGENAKFVDLGLFGSSSANFFWNYFEAMSVNGLMFELSMGLFCNPVFTAQIKGDLCR